MRYEKKQARRENRANKKNYTNRGERVIAQASLQHARFGPRKARLLADLIRGKSVGQALNILTFSVKPSVQPSLLRLLKSAVSNVAEDAYTDAELNQLVLGDVQVDSAMIIKRYRPRAMGRINRIRKRTCHMTIKLVDRGAARKAAPVAAPVASAPEAAAPESEGEAGEE